MAVPCGVAMLIAPLLAPAGTVAVIEPPDAIVNCALTPLKLTAVAPVKFTPDIVTLLPSAPLAGENPVIVGGLNDRE